MNILFFDTETTGLPKNWKASYREVYNWPRIIQLAWLVADECGNTIRQRVDLIKPDGWRMPTEKFWVEHNYTQEENMRLGIPIEDALNLFFVEKAYAHGICAHNISYDTPVILAETVRAGIAPPINIVSKYCTKDIGTAVCRLPGNYGQFKWPKLEELYRYLFGKNFDGAHDAMADVEATKACFFEMVKRGHIKL